MASEDRAQAAAPIRLAIMGEGRMGTLVRETACAAQGVAGELAFAVVAQIGFDLAAATQAEPADVLIDFSNVATLNAVCDYVRRSGCALISGTTGYSEAQMSQLRELANEAPVLHSGNYSLGIAALRHATSLVARELAGFDVEIVECHHNQKVDAPSGTAKLLLGAVAQAEAAAGRGRYEPVYGREGMVGARGSREVGMHSLRGGTVAGVHTVGFYGQDEEVTLTHRATSRQIFVTGALAAARKMVGRPAGWYDFDAVMFEA